jgi:hypothetical protein
VAAEGVDEAPLDPSLLEIDVDTHVRPSELSERFVERRRLVRKLEARMREHEVIADVGEEIELDDVCAVLDRRA